MISKYSKLTGTFFKIALIQLITFLGGTFSLLINYIVSCKIFDTTALVCLEYCIPYFLLIFAFANLCSAGLQASCSKLIGLNKKDQAVKVFFISALIIFAVSVLICVLVFVFKDTLLLFLGVDGGDDVYTCCYSLIDSFIFAGPGLCAIMIIVAACQMESNLKATIVAAVAMIILDAAIVLCAIFNFDVGVSGLWMIPTCCYYVILAALIIWLIVVSKKFSKIKDKAQYCENENCENNLSRGFFNNNKPASMQIFNFVMLKNSKEHYSWKSLVLVLKEGLPSAISQLSNTAFVLFINYLIRHFCGEEYLSILFYLNSISALVLSVSTSFGSSTLILSSRYHSGAISGDSSSKKSLSQLFIVFVGSCIVVYSIITIVLCFARVEITNWFLGSDISIIEDSIYAFVLYCLALVPVSIVVSWRNYIQGKGRIIMSQIVSFLQNFVSKAICAYLIVALFGSQQVWWMYLISALLMIAFMGGYGLYNRYGDKR